MKTQTSFAAVTLGILALGVAIPQARAVPPSQVNSITYHKQAFENRGKKSCSPCSRKKKSCNHQDAYTKKAKRDNPKPYWKKKKGL